MTIDIVPHPIHYKNEDTAKRLVSDGALKFARPWIAAGGLKFTWPVGTEGFRIYGQRMLAIHRYIGGNTPDVHAIHFHEGRIEISGTLPGLTSPANLLKLQDILMSRNKLTLGLPGILSKIQYVEVENYDFPHTADDRTSSIDYTITLIRIGNTGGSPGGSSSGGTSTSDSASQASTGPQGAPLRASVSESDRTYTVTQGTDTFQAIADKVYGDTNKWPALVDANKETLFNNNPTMINVKLYEIPYYRWPTGTKIAY